MNRSVGKLLLLFASIWGQPAMAADAQNVILAKAGIPFRCGAEKLGPRVREDDGCYKPGADHHHAPYLR